MRAFYLSISFAILISGIYFPMESASAAADKCGAPVLAKVLKGRMQKQGKSDTEIKAVLNSRFKRRILLGKVEDGSGCSSDQIEKAFLVLEASVTK